MSESRGIAGVITSSFLDWPGKICSVIFMKGCRLRCWYCHNKGIAWTPEAFATMTIDDVRDMVMGGKHDMYRGYWLDGITISGGEPTDDPQTLFQLLSAFNSMKIKLDTNGTNPEILKRVLTMSSVRAVHMDIKAVLIQRDYEEVCGSGVDVDQIIASIKLLRSASDHGVEVVFRTTKLPEWDTTYMALIHSHLLEHFGSSTKAHWITQELREVKKIT